MKRNIHHTILLTFIMSVPFSAYGQDIQPCISPTAVFTLVDGTEETSGQVSGSAPIKGHFAANPSDVGEWTATYEWRVTKEEKVEEEAKAEETKKELSLQKKLGMMPALLKHIVRTL